MNKKIIIFAGLIGIMAMPLMSAAAVTGSAATSTRATSTSAAKPLKAVKGAIARCPIIESKIQVKVTAFDNAKIKHLAVYDNLKTRLATLADRLTARSVDVSALRADLVILDGKIAKFNADYAAYVAKLKASQEGVCGKSEAQFKALLKETKVALAQVHKDAADIRAYVQTTIKAEIVRIRTSLKTPATTTTSTLSSKKATSTEQVKKVKPLVPPLPKLD